MQQESRMKEQAVRIECIHQEEFLWQSTATWEQLLEREREGAVESIPGNGRYFSIYRQQCVEGAIFSSTLLAHGVMVPKK